MEILKKPVVKDAIINIIYLILIVLYFVVFNIQANLLDSTILYRIIDISSMIFLAVSIIMFEIEHRNNKAKIFTNGFEFLVLAIFTLLIKHVPKVLGNTMKTYTEIGIYTSVAYYILKIAIMYTKQKQDELKKLSDIKEIVKEEPTKKATKRKNKKVEEGK